MLLNANDWVVVSQFTLLGRYHWSSRRSLRIGQVVCVSKLWFHLLITFLRFHLFTHPLFRLINSASDVKFLLGAKCFNVVNKNANIQERKSWKYRHTNTSPKLKYVLFFTS